MKINNSLFVLCILFFIGIIGHSISVVRPIMLVITPWILLLTGTIALMPVLREKNSSFIFWFIGCLVLTFIIEVVGVKTGLVFGVYDYGQVLGFKMFGVPLIIGANWIFVILGSVCLIDRLVVSNSRSAVLLKIISAATLTTGFDYILEPVAIKLGYWNWHTGVIPVQNYLAWFAIAFFAALFFNLLKVKLKSPFPYYYFLIQFIFFLALRFIVI